MFLDTDDFEGLDQVAVCCNVKLSVLDNFETEVDGLNNISYDIDCCYRVHYQLQLVIIG
jgi:hypothetical protein